MNPLIDFTKLIRNCNVEPRYFFRAFRYYFKFAFFEPFRWYENIFYKEGYKYYDIPPEKEPVFILGYYRSGTTHLQEVLLQDNRFSYLNFFKCYFPTAFNSSEFIFFDLFNFIIQTTGFIHPAHNIPFKFDLPAEEDVAMVASGSRLAANWGNVFPGHFKEFFNKTVFFETCTKEEREEFENELFFLFKRTYIHNNFKQLLLKSPPQTARIKMLYNKYPNAKFIFIRRNPYEVYKSNIKLWKSFEGQHLHGHSKEMVQDAIFWSYNKTHEYYEKDKHIVPENQLVELSFENFVTDPLSSLENIYKKINLDTFEESLPNFKKYLDLKHGGKRIASYNYSEDEISAVNSNMGKWIDYWSYKKLN